jgi:hypothetical protein
MAFPLRIRQSDCRELDVLLHRLQPLRGDRFRCGSDDFSQAFLFDLLCRCTFRELRPNLLDQLLDFSRLDQVVVDFVADGLQRRIDRGMPVKMNRTAFGCVLRIALTTVNPSPGRSMLRSEIRTSNFFFPISRNARAQWRRSSL